MPTPTVTETQDEFIQRCIPIVIEDGTAEDGDQAVAICHSLWEQGESENDKMSSKATEHKTLPLIVTKIDGEQGIVEHTVAVMGNVDLGNDRIHPGAFTKTISERMGNIRVLDTHNSTSVLDVIGKPLALWEVGHDQLPSPVKERFPDATGALMARTQFLMDTPEGKGAFIRIRDGAVSEYSIGYDALDVDFTDEVVDEKEAAVRNLRTIRLWEYSPVAFAMNPATSTVSAKATAQTAFDEEDRAQLIAWIKNASREEGSRLWQAYVLKREGKRVLDKDKGASGSTSLPIAARDRAWDATAAVAGVRSATGSEDEPSARYRSAFFWFDAENAENFGAYKLPFAASVDGTLTAVPRGIFAGAQRLDATDIPATDKEAVRRRMTRYYTRMRSQFDDDSIVPPWDKADDTEHDQKIGRAISAANAGRIRAVIDRAQEALADLEAMLGGALPAQDEDEQARDALADAPKDVQQAATGHDQAGPDVEPPTDSVKMADIEQWIKNIEADIESAELSEETQ